jgi:hypothetical protein
MSFRLGTWRPVARALIVAAIATAAAVSLAPASTHATETGTTIVRPAPELTVGAIAQIAGRPTGESAPTQALIISTQRADLSLEEASRLADGQGVPGVTVVRSASGVAVSTTVGTLTNGEPAPQLEFFVRQCIPYPGSSFCCYIVIIWRLPGQ